jgi:hypothetical protein
VACVAVGENQTGGAVSDIVVARSYGPIFSWSVVAGVAVGKKKIDGAVGNNVVARSYGPIFS